jgi:hypothetical protein
LELALESLENKKRQLDEEIAEVARTLQGGTVALATVQEGLLAQEKGEEINRELVVNRLLHDGLD